MPARSFLLSCCARARPATYPHALYSQYSFLCEACGAPTSKGLDVSAASLIRLIAEH